MSGILTCFGKATNQYIVSITEKNVESRNVDKKNLQMVTPRKDPPM